MIMSLINGYIISIVVITMYNPKSWEIFQLLILHVYQPTFEVSITGGFSPEEGGGVVVGLFDMEGVSYSLDSSVVPRNHGDLRLSMRIEHYQHHYH